MKEKLILLFLSLFYCSSLFAQQGTFDEANTLFENGELNEAMALYRSIENEGQVSGALFLNMGITAVQLDSLGLAKYYFLKAHDFETTTQQANEALTFVSSQFSRQSAILPKLPWDRAVDWINDEVTAFGLFLIGFLITIAGLTLLYLGWLEKISLRKTFPYLITLIITGSVVSGFAFYADYVNQRYDEAILISNSQRVLQQPESESTLVSIAYEGYDLTIDQWESTKHDNWLYVRLGNGQFGWVRNEGIKIL